MPHHPIRLAERIISTPGTPESDQQAQDAADAPGDAAASPAGASRAILRRRRIGILLAVAAFAYLLDLGSKMLVVAKLEGHDPIRVIGDVLEFQVIRNSGAAFSMGQAMTIVFTAIAAAVIVVICRLARKLYSLPWAIALGLLLGGALGNLTDRIFRWPSIFRGEVVDFISVKHFAVFNLADSAIVCGGILVVLLSFLGTNPDGSTHREGGKPEERPEKSDGPSVQHVQHTQGGQSGQGGQNRDSGGTASAEVAG